MIYFTLKKKLKLLFTTEFTEYSTEDATNTGFKYLKTPIS
ncbi:hypothetical protein SAMN04489724_0717 [Algoriphagus locisalis]|uniref:Uncharacterized protein n=1 Tax=Algoriphagus locisalis TaxID=305507 RepID=A0A1I6XXR9_9BACT|nr:hypothetical protein SAMN04489724_0717 [Algoriphagus locisalis]